MDRDSQTQTHGVTLSIFSAGLLDQSPIKLWRSIAHRIVTTPAASRLRWVCSRVHTRNSARELDIGRAHITPLLKVVHGQLPNQQSRRQPMAAAESRCPSGERACTRAKGKRDTTHSFVLSSARTLRTPRPSYFKDSLNWPNTNV